MKNKIIAASVVLLLIVGFMSGYFFHRAVTKPIAVGSHTDTVYVDKHIDIPVTDPVSVRPSGRDVTVSVPDCKSHGDSLDIPAVLAEYRDTLSDGVSYIATVSGVAPKLESLHFSYNLPQITTTRTVVKPFKGWLMSATSNNAVIGTGSLGLCSQTAFEVSYNNGPFHLGLQGGVQIEKPFSQEAPRLSPYLGGRITVDILKISR